MFLFDYFALQARPSHVSHFVFFICLSDVGAKRLKVSTWNESKRKSVNLTKSTRERARKTPGAVNCNARVRSEKSTRRISTRQAIFARDLMSSSRVAQLFLSRKGLLVVQEIRDHGGVLKLNHLSKQPLKRSFLMIACVASGNPSMSVRDRVESVGFAALLRENAR